MKFSSSLSQSIIENVTEAIYYRGLEYADQGKVKELEEQEKKLVATVVGSKNYEVEFRQGPVHTKGYCSCPYQLANQDYCKHIIAVAIAWDRSRGKDIPTDEIVKSQTIEIDYGFGAKVDAMYDNPLEADLRFLATASEYSSWGVRPHAKLPLVSTLAESVEPLTLKEVKTAFNKIERFTNRATYDYYFCAGEVSAILSMTYDVLVSRLKSTEYLSGHQIVLESIVFYYNVYLQSIDSSDGVWSIPKARLPLMISQLVKMGLDPNNVLDLGDELNARIDGWGDILADLEIKT